MPSLTHCHDAHFDESNRSRIVILIAIVVVESKSNGNCNSRFTHSSFLTEDACQSIRLECSPRLPNHLKSNKLSLSTFRRQLSISTSCSTSTLSISEAMLQQRAILHPLLTDLLTTKLTGSKPNIFSELRILLNFFPHILTRLVISYSSSIELYLMLK